MRKPAKPFQSKPIEVSINPTLPSPLSSHGEGLVLDPATGDIVIPNVTSVVPSKIPDWLIILTVYSLVIVGILLISNVTPNGKLYIHFTAFWSMIIYFLLDDNIGNDVLDSVVEGMVTKKRIPS